MSIQNQFQKQAMMDNENETLSVEYNDKESKELKKGCKTNWNKAIDFVDMLQALKKFDLQTNN